MNHQYRKKPVVIEAFQMTREQRDSNADWPEWLNRAWQMDSDDMGAVFLNEHEHVNQHLLIRTLEGLLMIEWGDWIIKGVAGELYPCKPDIFEKTYEQAEGGT